MDQQLAVEEVLEPDIEIVDSHHHLGNNHGRPYYLDELLADTSSGHRVVETVFVEAGWGMAPDRPDDGSYATGEVERVAALGEESEARGGSVIKGIIGWVDLRRGGSSAADALDAAVAAGNGRLVGVRYVTGWDADPAVPVLRTTPTPGMMQDPLWLAGFAALEGRGLVFDSLVYHPQMPEVVDLAKAFPDVPIVLNHSGFPLAVGAYEGRREETVAFMHAQHERMAALPNVYLKLGGIGVPMIRALFEPDLQAAASSERLAAQWGPYLRSCVETFGADRCMLESNFPVDALTCSYRTLWNVFKRVFADLDETSKAQLFAGTARRVYGLGAANERVTA